MEKLVSEYLTDKCDAKSPNVSPMFNGDFDGIPSTLILSAELDTLFDDSLKYFEKLQKAKINSKHVVLKGAVHGFFDSRRFVYENLLSSR